MHEAEAESDGLEPGLDPSCIRRNRARTATADPSLLFSALTLGNRPTIRLSRCNSVLFSFFRSLTTHGRSWVFSDELLVDHQTAEPPPGFDNGVLQYEPDISDMLADIHMRR